MPPTIRRRRLVEGHAADDIDAELHRLAHQRLGTGRFDNALLRKCDDLDIHEFAKAVAGANEALGRPRAPDRIDVDMGSQTRNAVRKSTLKHARRAICDFVDRVIALDLPENLDRLGERP